MLNAIATKIIVLIFISLTQQYFITSCIFLQSDLRETFLGISHSVFLTRLQSSCWPGMKLSPGLTLIEHFTHELNQIVVGGSPFGENSSLIINILIKIIVDNVEEHIIKGLSIV